MKVEFIIDKNEYKKLLSKDTFNERISHRSESIKGKGNYLFTLECEGKNVSTAKILSESRITIDKLFSEHEVKYRLLTEEASQFFVQRLYPYACEFETKLRKFIYTALFDIDEKAECTILKTYKSTLGSDTEKNITKLPLSDFLSEKNLGDIFDFLFANDEFLSQVKTLSTPKSNHQRHTTKKEILDKLNNLNDKTVWTLIFAPIFGDSVLPKIYKDIQSYRNKIMHLRNIDYEDYTQALKSFNKGIKDLDFQISKGIVIKDSKINVDALASSLGFLRECLLNLQINENVITDMLKKSNLNYLSSIHTLSTSFSPLLEQYAKIQTQLRSITAPNIALLAQIAKLSDICTNLTLAENEHVLSEKLKDEHITVKDYKKDKK